MRPRLPALLVGLALAVLADAAAGERFQVRTEPPGARVYVDWREMGVTPLDLELEVSGGVMLVFKEGFEPRLRQLADPRPFIFELQPVPEPQLSRVFLTVLTEQPGNVRPALAEALGEYRDVLGTADAEFFITQFLRAAPQAWQPFALWAESHFRTSHWIVVDQAPPLYPDLLALIDPRTPAFERPPEEAEEATEEEPPRWRMRIVSLRSGQISAEALIPRPDSRRNRRAVQQATLELAERIEEALIATSGQVEPEPEAEAEEEEEEVAP